MTLSNADRLEIIALLGQFHEYLEEELDAYTSPDGSIVDVDFDDAERARRLRSRIEKVVESIEETPGSLQAGERCSHDRLDMEGDLSWMRKGL